MLTNIFISAAVLALIFYICRLIKSDIKRLKQSHDALAVQDNITTRVIEAQENDNGRPRKKRKKGRVS